MTIRLAEIATQVGAGAHAVLVRDGAGWHQAGQRLVMPDNITLLRLPFYAPELNPIERVWLYLREKHLSHRLLNDYDAIVEALCKAWRKLDKDRLKSLTSYPYVKQIKT